jgi:thiol-disulfide isomerase/thioredoxin
VAASESAQQAPEPVAVRRRVRAIGVWAVLLSMMFPVAIVGFYVLFETSTETGVDAAIQHLAEANAGGPVQAFTGSQHTVYQSIAPLPTAGSPRSDAKPTLVWFSSTGCGDCHRMESFVEQTAQQVADRAVFVEKSIDRDASAGRYGVTSAPTFVLVDAQGRELARFGYQPSAEAFKAAISGAFGPGR